MKSFMKNFCKNKFIFKMYNILKLFRSNSYCLITSHTENKNVMVDAGMINIFTDRQLDDLLSRVSLYVKDIEIAEAGMEDVLKEAAEILNLK